jgi:hypothetical protein
MYVPIIHKSRKKQPLHRWSTKRGAQKDVPLVLPHRVGVACVKGVRQVVLFFPSLLPSVK